MRLHSSKTLTEFTLKRGDIDKFLVPNGNFVDTLTYSMDILMAPP